MGLQENGRGSLEFCEDKRNDCVNGVALLTQYIPMRMSEETD
jgi:hypothetical protein